VEFVWDPRKNDSNIDKHGIDFADAYRIFAAPMLVALDELDAYGEERWIGIGHLDARVVVVVFTEPDERTIRIISLRKAQRYERELSKSTSRTDWDRVDRLTDEEIDISDSPALSEEFFRRAKWREPSSTVVTIRVDPEVLAWFQTTGDEWERRMAAALRIYAEAHRGA
jgi:uncharacterized DUF497 family protein